MFSVSFSQTGYHAFPANDVGKARGAFSEQFGMLLVVGGRVNASRNEDVVLGDIGRTTGDQAVGNVPHTLLVDKMVVVSR